MSQDNININVQETNDIVNIVSSEVTEVIDINIAETIEEVTLNITEEVIQVNINKITATVTENLQQVTDNGNRTTNNIIVENGSYYSIVEPYDVGSANDATGTYTYIGADGVIGIKTDAAEGNIKTTNLINSLTLEFPDKTGSKTIATTEDIPTATSDLTNDSGFITAAEVPTVNDATASVKGILKLTNDLGGTADLPTVPGLANKVDKVTGKGLSTNDYTTAEQTKLAGIAAGAEVNVNADWNATSGDAQILNKPSLATVATSGSYTDLSNKPTIPAAQIQSDWNQTNNTSLDYIKNKPSLTGFGDMLKSTYDVDNTGIVDNAEAIKIIGRNSTGSTLYRGTVVYLNGATGNRPNFAKAQANAESTSAGTFGVIVDDLSNNSDGYCIALGYLDNLDTRSTATNPFTTDTLSAGDTIYLSPTNAGYITNVKPSAPNHLVYLGKVTRTSPTNGTIVYRIQNGYELEELHNVAISSVTDKQLLSYDNATSLWKNKSVTTADIADSTNKRYVTDSNLTTIGNQSGTNTGDETTATIKTKLGAATTSVDGYLTSTDWNVFNGKATKVNDAANQEDSNIWDIFFNKNISWFLGKANTSTYESLRVQNMTQSGQSSFWGGVSYLTTATAGSLAFQRGFPNYLNGGYRKFQANVISTDARYFIGLSNMYPTSNPTNIDPASQINCIGVAKLSTSNNLFIIHNDASGVCTSVDLGVNYPANSTLYYYDIKILNGTSISVRRTTYSDLSVIIYNYTAPNNFPTVSINPVLWLTNNATAAANSIYDFGGIGFGKT